MRLDTSYSNWHSAIIMGCQTGFKFLTSLILHCWYNKGLSWSKNKWIEHVKWEPGLSQGLELIGFRGYQPLFATQRAGHLCGCVLVRVSAVPLSFRPQTLVASSTHSSLPYFSCGYQGDWLLEVTIVIKRDWRGVANTTWLKRIVQVAMLQNDCRTRSWFCMVVSEHQQN